MQITKSCLGHGQTQKIITRLVEQRSRAQGARVNLHHESVFRPRRVRKVVTGPMDQGPVANGKPSTQNRVQAKGELRK